MNSPIPQFQPFNQLLIGKSPIYIFPLPHGPRVIVACDGDSVVMFKDGDATRRTEITGFAPYLEAKFAELYTAMMSEPNPAYTLNGKQVKFPTLVFDVILTDAAEGEANDGSDDDVRKHLSDYDEIGAPAPDGSITALVLCVMFDDEFAKGKTAHDIWWQRAWLTRGLRSINMGNPHMYPRPAIKPLTQSPRNWRYEYSGIASDLPDVCWDMIYNCFAREFDGALIVDVWQPWKARGDAFRVLREGDVEL